MMPASFPDSGGESQFVLVPQLAFTPVPLQMLVAALPSLVENAGCVIHLSSVLVT